MRALIKGDKINGHKILSREGDTFFVECGNCRSYTTKNKGNLYKNKGCINCRMGNNQHIKKHRFTLKTMCWILGLNEGTVKSRIQRGWTLKEALYQDKRVFIESFNEKDFKYISEFNTKHYDTDKALEDKAYENYLLNRYNEYAKTN